MCGFLEDAWCLGINVYLTTNVQISLLLAPISERLVKTNKDGSLVFDLEKSTRKKLSCWYVE